MSVFRIEIDQSLCVGYGGCAKLAPDVFALDADGIASIRVGTSDDPAVLEAADTCPMGAILVTETRAA